MASEKVGKDLEYQEVDRKGMVFPALRTWAARVTQCCSLNGEGASPFASLIIEGLTEEDAVFYRDLHIQLRVKYRSHEEARALTAKLTSTDTLREQLTQGIAQMGELAQRN